MQSTRKARWQQATALVSLSTAGAMTGLSVAHGTAADLTSPSSIPVKLLASSRPATPAAPSDRALRSAIVKAAQYYLRLAQSRPPSEMEALIWQNDSTDGVDHGESCAAFASLTLESGAQATGQQSWVTGGTTYPWPVHAWVDSRVDPNPASPDVISILQDAQAHQRWHPLGDGYTPQPGDWVLFDGHVEVVTKYAGGVLYTIGGDSMPNLSVNAHQYSAPLAAQGVTGFVNNGVLVSAVSQTSGGGEDAAPAQAVQDAAQAAPDQGQAELPGPGDAGPQPRQRGAGRGAGAAAGHGRLGRCEERADQHGEHSRRAAGHRQRDELLVGDLQPAVQQEPGRPEHRAGSGHGRRSRPSSTRSRRARWRRSGSTASPRRSRSRRPSTNQAGARASSPPRTTTCSGSRERARRARSWCRPRSTRTASRSR